MNWKVERLSCSLWTKISQLICLSPSPSCFFICHFVVKISQLKTHQPWEKLCMIGTGTWTVWLWHNCCLFISKPCGKYYVLARKSHDTLYTDILNLFFRNLQASTSVLTFLWKERPQISGFSYHTNKQNAAKSIKFQKRNGIRPVSAKIGSEDFAEFQPLTWQNWLIFILKKIIWTKLYNK